MPALDGLRGLAILLVLLYHCTVMRSDSEVDRAVGAMLEFGWAGVDLFFVLSGFLITGILFDAKGAPNYFRNFYMRRTLRIFPLYYAVVAMSLLVIPGVAALLAEQFNNPTIAEKVDRFGRIEGDEIWYWLYLSNFAIAGAGTFRHGILDISWSLAIEEQFYLVWPALMAFLSRRNAMRLCVGVVLGAIALRSVLTLGFQVNPIAVYVLTPCRMDALAIGAWIALVARGPIGVKGMFQHAQLVYSLAAVGLLGVAFFGPNLPGAHDTLGDGGAFNLLMQTVGYTLIAVFFGALLIQALVEPRHTWLGRALYSRPLAVLGKYSYAIYLFHLPIRAVVRDLFYGPDQFLTIAGSALPGQIIFFAISISLTLIAAWLSWHLYEKPFLKLKRFFPSGAGRAAGKPQPVVAATAQDDPPQVRTRPAAPASTRAPH